MTMGTDRADDGQELLRCEGLVIGHRGHALLPAQDLALRRGELVAVLGRNGSGKTTFFRTLLGLQAPVAGKIVRATPEPRFGYMAQAAALDRHLPLRVRDVVAFGLLGPRGLSPPLLGPGERAACAAALEAVGIAPLARGFFRDLSEGQKQRVLLARLLASRPDVALLDEPTAAMDAISEEATLVLLERLAEERHMAIVLITHSLASALRHADRAVWFDRPQGRVLAGHPKTLLANPDFRAGLGFLAEAVGPSAEPPAKGAEHPDGAAP
jgi:zinc transport system ATP-binding protein